MRVMLCVAIGCLGLLTGCAATMPGPGQVFPGAIVNTTTSPREIGPNQMYDAYPDSFEVVGMVEGTASSTNILGLFSFGDAGYIAAVQDALSGVEGDGLINPVVDIRTKSFIAIFASSETTVRGLAIKRKSATGKR
jgi:hypothetical protein